MTLEKVKSEIRNLQAHKDWHDRNGIHSVFEYEAISNSILSLSSAVIGETVTYVTSVLGDGLSYNSVVRESVAHIGFSRWCPEPPKKAAKRRINFKALRQVALERYPEKVAQLKPSLRTFIERGLGGSTGRRGWLVDWMRYLGEPILYK